MTQKYLHGYDDVEQSRLTTQNSILAKYIYDRCPFDYNQRILEVGCGVGAQMDYVLRNFSPSQLTGVDISVEQINQAKVNLVHHPNSQYDLIACSIEEYQPNLPYDALLMVWVLEHVPDPQLLLNQSLSHLKRGATVFITEVNHKSMLIGGASEKFYQLWNASVDYQTNLGGDANIGQKLPQLFENTGKLADIDVSPYLMQFDQSQSLKRDELLTYIIDLVQSAALPMIADNYIEESLWLRVKEELACLVGQQDASFSYSFIQGRARVI